jgi:hypothetical protein
VRRTSDQVASRFLLHSKECNNVGVFVTPVRRLRLARATEYDHIVSVSKGGANTVRTIELRCEPSNRKRAAGI